MKALSMAPFVYHLIHGNVDQKTGMWSRLLTEYIPKCYSPVLIFIVNTLLLYYTIQACDDKGIFDNWRSFHKYNQILTYTLVTLNIIVYIISFVAFTMDSIGLYKIYHSEATSYVPPGEVETITSMIPEIHVWFWKGYVLLCVVKFISILFSAQFLLSDIYLLSYLKSHILYQNNELFAAKRLLFLHALIGVAALIAKGLSAYGLMDNHWMELVWVGDVLYLIVFNVIFIVIELQNPNERERQVWNSVNGDGIQDEFKDNDVEEETKFRVDKV
jgi:hypothetical protein